MGYLIHCSSNTTFLLAVGCPHLASESYILLVTHHEITTFSRHYSITPQCSNHLTADAHIWRQKVTFYW